MVGAPQLVKKILQPFQKKLPKIYAVLFIVIGMTTIVGRLSHMGQPTHTDHATHGKVTSCH